MTDTRTKRVLQWEDDINVNELRMWGHDNNTCDDFHNYFDSFGFFMTHPTTTIDAIHLLTKFVV